MKINFIFFLFNILYYSGCFSQASFLKIKQYESHIVTLKKPAIHIGVVHKEILDIHLSSPCHLHLYAKKPGMTTIYAMDEDNHLLFQKLVCVKTNLTILKHDLKKLAPHILLSSLQGSVLLKGYVESLQQRQDAHILIQEHLKNHKIIDKTIIRQSQQVNLRVRIAEIVRHTHKELNIKWKNILSPSHYIFGTTTNFGKSFTQTSQVNIRHRTHNNDINGLIDALASEGIVTILAEPDLTALSGEKASFLAGGEVPLPAINKEQANVIYKEFGVRLTFIPTLLDNQLIRLKIMPEVSEISDTYSTQIKDIILPGMRTRKAETTIELKHGQSFAMAGLLQNNTSSAVAGFPILQDIPILGVLFRSTRFKRQESELAIIVTPYLVHPSQSSLKTPIDDYVPANDVELFLHKNLTQPKNKKRPIFKKSIGFILDVPPL